MTGKPEPAADYGDIRNGEDFLRAVDVSRETLQRLEIYVDNLLHWQSRFNLVSAATLERLWSRHIADSAQLLELGGDGATWLDLGSGAGLPGLVLAIMLADHPGARVHLVEANAKKCAFLRETARLTGAPVDIHCCRIETLAQEWRFAAPIDIVTARALAPLAKLLGYAEPFIRVGAVGLFPKGRDVERELIEARKCWHISELQHYPSRVEPGGRVLRVGKLRSKPEGLSQ